MDEPRILKVTNERGERLTIETTYEFLTKTSTELRSQANERLHEYSRLVRAGQMSRDELIERIFILDWVTALVEKLAFLIKPVNVKKEGYSNGKAQS